MVEKVRCRLVASWGWSRSQGLGCSPIKAARELGSERRETVNTVAVYKSGQMLEKPSPKRSLVSWASHGYGIINLPQRLKMLQVRSIMQERLDGALDHLESSE